LERRTLPVGTRSPRLFGAPRDQAAEALRSPSDGPRDPATELFGAPPSPVPPGSDPRLFGVGSPPPGPAEPPTPPRQALHRSSERRILLAGHGRPGSSEPRAIRPPRPFGVSAIVPRDPATELFGAPPSPVPGPGSPALRSQVAPSTGIGLPALRGSELPLPRLDLRAYAPRTSGDRGRRGHRLRPAPHAGQDSNDRKATGRSDAFPAVDEGNSSEGANRTAGTDPGRWPPSGDLLPARTKRGEPSAGCGVQQTRNSCAEQTVMVVRNHEGGT
jgi:hypothetical protein